jgi:S1-C subfamily serine protease
MKNRQMQITYINKQARTFMPEIIAPGTGLTPVTQKSVIPTNNVTTIQDVLEGKQYKLPGGGGDWSTQWGSDTAKNYKEEGDAYKRSERDMEHLEKLLNRPENPYQEIWEVKVPGGKKRFNSLGEAHDFKRKMKNNGVNVQWITRTKLAQNQGVNKVSLVAESLEKTFMVEVINIQEGVKLNGAAFCVAPGYFLTCAHVIQKYNKNLQKTLDPKAISSMVELSLIQAGRKVPAQLINMDAANDIAIIKSNINIEPFKLNQQVAVGEDVIAIGSPHGYENNSSFGSVGSLNRKIYNYKGAPNYLFIDAAVFTGNSGGPIIKQTDGTVIGMLTAIVSAKGDYGLNAGLPANYLIAFCKANGINV